MAVYIILAKWHWLTHSVAAVANTPIEKQIEMPWYLSHSLFELDGVISWIIQLVLMYEIRSTIKIATIVKDKK